MITLLAVALAACALAPTRAHAQAAPGGGPPTGVGPACSIAGVTALSFGPYDPISAAAVPAVSSISYRCPARARIMLSAGASGTYARRTMVQGSEVLRYNLFLDASHATIWGDGTAGTGVGPLSPSTGGGTATVYVYGLVEAAQDPVAGIYADTIEVTVEF